MPTIAPCLWFDDQAEQAAKLYTSIFPDSRATGTSRYPEDVDNPSRKPPGSVATVELELADQPFTLLNGGPHVEPNPSISFILNFDPSRDPEAREHLDATWEALAPDGEVRMPLDTYPFSERYGWVEDRYGVNWQLMLSDPEGDPRPFIVPSLLFVGDVAGRAEEAIDLYTSVFEDASRGIEARYGPDQEPEEEGTLMFADFKLEDQWFAAMDSGHDHEFTFNEGVSLQVRCEDQAQIDRYWDALTADGGKEGPCGWLTDRFGVSWQVLPTSFVEMMTAGEGAGEGHKRAFQAMLEMDKLDIGTLEASFENDGPP